jgi:glycosidase
MPVTVEASSPTLVAGASLVPRAPVFPSPTDWRDEVLYFLLPDRFSDGQEALRPAFDRNAPGQHAAASKSAWMQAGNVFQGGTIAGIASKLDYLRGLGATALWIGPVFKQRADIPTYHGYAVQDFLEVDPRFGTRQELRDLVDQAHDKGLYVLLDIIINHSGNNWFYERDGAAVDTRDYRFEPPYPLFRWRSKTGQPITTIGNDRDDGVWPREFQDTEFYTRAGSIKNFDAQPWENRLDPRTEFRRGDFFSLKDLRVQESAPFVADARAAAVTNALVRVYQYWIALLDIDGFRVDTIKHVSFEASRNFCGAIHEFTESIGKENFLVLGEVAGGAGLTRDYLDVFGRNLDAALDLGQPMDVLTSMIKGLGAPPADFFAQFGGHDELGTHREVGRYHVSVLDDHDMINRNPKARFCAGNAAATRFAQVAHAVGAQLTTLGIPCIYYGTEQALDGSEAYHDLAIEGLGEDGKIPFRDRYIREAMFGGSFGAFGTSGCHFFDLDHPTYLRIAAIARVVGGRDRTGKALRRGRQYPREVRFLAASGYQPPRQGELIAWSRVMFDREVVVALNTNGAAARGGDVTVDRTINPPGRLLTVLYRSDWSDAQLRAPPAGQTVAVTDDNGRSIVRIDLPAAGMMILA